MLLRWVVILFLPTCLSCSIVALLRISLHICLALQTSFFLIRWTWLYRGDRLNYYFCKKAHHGKKKTICWYIFTCPCYRGSRDSCFSCWHRKKTWFEMKNKSDWYAWHETQKRPELSSKTIWNYLREKKPKKQNKKNWASFYSSKWCSISRTLICSCNILEIKFHELERQWDYWVMQRRPSCKWWGPTFNLYFLRKQIRCR